MLGYFAQRALTLIPTLFAVLTLAFVLVRIVPGDPALIILGDQASPEAIARFHQETGLDQPIWRQYLAFLSELAQGDLGVSMISNRPVLTSIMEVLPYTLELSFAGVFVGVALGVPLGVIAARSNGGWTDWAVRIFTLGGLSFPAFVSAVMMLLVFSVWLGWFPVISSGKPITDPAGRLMSLALPAINLGLVMMAYVARVTRGGMMNIMRADYIRTARAKGVPRRRIVWKHALRNVLLAVVTFTGLYFSVLIGNSVLTEIVFNRPGLGKLVIGALERRDYTLLQGLVVAYAILVVLVNALTDLCYGVVDPRVKTS
ncbi:ABC transporter permease [Roseovarius spongiae]|uniref:ABC transporter permease n=1 Tax=Roseovarius spongiae TaxID=2320272 RepID=A0A3A8B3I6_9RHOB|nr:ABC transporter permease [Roseovarius spongiae]RKF15382.1 ABC transporter permease [Roseovarius spongiae]